MQKWWKGSQWWPNPADVPAPDGLNRIRSSEGTSHLQKGDRSIKELTLLVCTASKARRRPQNDLNTSVGLDTA